MNSSTFTYGTFDDSSIASLKMSDPSSSTAVAAVETSHHRLHISGIHHSTKASELVQRFSSFGTIVGGEAGVGGLGVDGNGEPICLFWFSGRRS